MKRANLLHISLNNGKVFESGGEENECESHDKSRQRLSPFRHAVHRASICPLLKSHSTQPLRNQSIHQSINQFNSNLATMTPNLAFLT